MRIIIGKSYPTVHRSLALIDNYGTLIVMSNYTGEVVFPWEIRKIWGMIRDFRL